MEKYQLIQRAGSGNFSEVYKARNLRTDEIVAIKEMKNSDEIEELLMRELKIAAGLEHPNIIKLKEIIKGHRDIRVVFEYMEENLLELYTSSRKGINEHQLRCILYQSALGLDYLHNRRIIHRDIKPENILINRKTALIKIIDFGLAKQDFLAETDYVATRWYRSPENLIGMKKSTVAIDIFALGCVAAELFTLNPLFPGTNTLDQLSKVFALLGTPTLEDWSKGYYQLKRKNYNFGTQPKRGIASVMSTASTELLDLLDKMLQMNPEKRITAREMLFHPFFNNIERVIPEHVAKEAQRVKEDINRRNRSNNSLLIHKNIEVSPNKNSTPYDNFYYNKDRKYLDTAGVSNVQQRSRERAQHPQTLHFCFDDADNKPTGSMFHSINKEIFSKVQPRPQRRFNYLKVENLSPPHGVQSGLHKSNGQITKSPNSQTSQIPTERTNILDRSSRGPVKNLLLNVDPTQYSRVLRNHSLIGEPLTATKSVEKPSLDLSGTRSIGKVQSPQSNYNTMQSNFPIRMKIY